MGDGESQVIADVLTARLLSVADEVRLLVTPHLDRCESRGETHTHTHICGGFQCSRDYVSTPENDNNDQRKGGISLRLIDFLSLEMRSDLVGGRLQHQDAEDEKHSEPNLAQNCGVTLHFIQQAAQQIPLTHFRR